MDVVDITLPAIEPVSLSRAKLFLRVEHDAEDELIMDMIRSARMRVETYVGASLIERQKRLTLDKLGGEIKINHHPVQNVQAVRFVWLDGQEQTLSPQQYSVNLRRNPARLSIEREVLRLFTRDVPCHLEIDIIAGYGASDTDVPTPLVQAILILLAQAYERDNLSSNELPMMVQALLMPYRGLRL